MSATSPFSSATSGVSAVMSARYAPADSPQMAILSSSNPYSAALALTNLTAALTSASAAGKAASPDLR